MADMATFDEISNRIRRDAASHGGVLSERTALVWDGYLAALIEWGLVSPAEHEDLRKLLPAIVDSPAKDILLGRSKGISA